MIYMKLLLLAPVYLETSTQFESDSDIISDCELRIQPPLDTKENKSVNQVSRKSASQVSEKCVTQVSKKFVSQFTKENVNQVATKSDRKDSRTSFDLLSSLPAHVDRCYLNFPFLTDRKTIIYLRSWDSKVMFITRGLSGSGKSTIVNVIRSSFKHCVCSADDFFYKDDGSYRFDETLLRAAHENCQQKAKQACKSGVPVVVIDNTNVRKWEFKFYTDLAKTSGYVVVLVQPKTPWRFNAHELAARSKHGVTAEILHRKILKFDDVIPAYYGWFLDEKRSKSLIRLSSDVFLECLSKFPAMRHDLAKEVQLENVHEDGAQDIFSECYSSESNRTPLLHCTSKFCAWGRAPEAKEYHQRSDVQQACGQMFVLSITGLVITKKTVGARISLESSASVYFDRPEEKEWVSQRVMSPQESRVLARDTHDGGELVKRSNRKAKKNPQKFLKNQQRKQKNHIGKREKYGKESLSEENGRLLADNQQVNHFDNTDVDFDDVHEAGSSFNSSLQKTTVSLSDMFPALNYCSRFRSAHVTVKTARGMESRQANFDILHACDVETSHVYTETDFVPVSRGQACYYGDGLCCVYFNTPLRVPTLFSGYY